MDLHTQGGNVIKVLLVDDHPVVRSGYLRLLSQEQGIQVVAEASNSEQGYQAYVQHRPDVTVTDVSMPGVGGLALLEKILQREPRALVLVPCGADAAVPGASIDGAAVTVVFVLLGSSLFNGKPLAPVPGARGLVEVFLPPLA